jgi:hypothetical protein
MKTKKKKEASNLKNETGKSYGSCIVIRKVIAPETFKTKRARNLAYWECKCICGKIFIACGSDLRNGKTKTCGCKKGIQSKRNFQGYKELTKTYFRSIFSNAKQRYIIFEITEKYIYELYLKQNKKCALSGEDISLSLSNHTASLDRIDSKLGYIEGNVQWVHKDINKLKNVYNNQDFKDLCMKVAKYELAKFNG